MKKTMKDIIKNIPLPKKLTKNTILPYIFDLYWDAKTYNDIILQGLEKNKTVKRLLAENGFKVE